MGKKSGKRFELAPLSFIDEAVRRSTSVFQKWELEGADRAVTRQGGGAVSDFYATLLIGGESNLALPHYGMHAEREVLQGSKLKKVSSAMAGVDSEAALIDWVSFTFHETSVYGWEMPVAVCDGGTVQVISMMLDRVFGFGCLHERKSGLNCYQRSWVLGNSTGEFGYLCYGGQRGTVLVQVNGQGCAAALPGWRGRLKLFLDRCERARITRIDLAYDDFEGLQYSPDKAKEDYERGAFNAGGRMPTCSQGGNWLRDDKRGRTFYVGRRENGKFLRVYEKGKQLKDEASPWVRVEVELKSVDRVIPLEVLERPGAYLAGSYAALGWISAAQDRIRTVVEQAKKKYAQALLWLKRQCGVALEMVRRVEGGSDKAMALLCADEVRFERLKGRYSIPNANEIPQLIFGEQSPAALLRVSFEAAS